MYLLELLHARLAGEKLALARQLMYKPWTCDIDLLGKYLPRKQLAAFKKIRRNCNAIVDPNTKPHWFLNVRLRALALRAFVFIEAHELIPTEIRALEMQEAFVGQAIEDLTDLGVSFRGLPAQDQAALVSLYAQACCCLWYVAGVYVPFGSGLDFKLTGDDDFKEALRLYWFGHHWSFQSNIADFELREKIVAALRSSGAPLEHAVQARAPVFQLFVSNVLDKYVSFHEDFSSLINSTDRRSYEAMYRRAALICYFYLKSHDDSKSLSVGQRTFGLNTALPHDYAIAAVRAAGFSDEEFDGLLAESANKGEGEAFIVRSGPDTVRMGMLGLKYAIGSYLKPMLAAMHSRGEWFDRKYIPAYLKKRVNGHRFRFGPEIKPRAEKEGKYDVDLLVVDEQHGRLYFCQIKHRITTLLPHFRDEFTEYTRHKQLAYAVEQLNGTKDQFGSPDFLDKLHRSLQKSGASPAFVGKVDAAFLRQHAGFIVIHTIENFDFAVKDGVAFYEWNTFRNLVRGEITVLSKGGVAVMRPELHGMPLDDPNRLSRALMTWSATHGADNPLHPEKQWFYALNTHFQMQETWDIKASGRRLATIRGATLAFPIL